MPHAWLWRLSVSYLVLRTAGALSTSRLVSPPRLETLEVAQQGAVVRVPGFLSPAQICELHAAAATVRESKGAVDVTRRQGAPTGSWHTVFLNERLLELQPSLHARLFDAARGADSTRHGGRLLDDERHPLRLRVAEYHRVTPGGGIPMAKHHDYGSLYTLDLMLSDSSEYEVIGPT